MIRHQVTREISVGRLRGNLCAKVRLTGVVFGRLLAAANHVT